MVLRQKGYLNSCSSVLHIDFLIGQFNQERILFNILLVCIFWILIIRHKFVFPIVVFRVLIKKNYTVCYLSRILDGQFLIPIA